MSGSAGNMASKRGTEDLDYFIGDEAVAASAGPGESERSHNAEQTGIGKETGADDDIE